jgi:hypothetical protein
VKAKKGVSNKRSDRYVDKEKSQKKAKGFLKKMNKKSEKGGTAIKG